MNEVKEMVEELRNKKSRDNRDLFDRSANMIEKLAKELCEKSPCHHKCHDTKDCVVEEEAEEIINNLPSMLTNCKDCIHYDVCESDSEDVALNLTWANKCQHFKDKADVVPKSEVERLETEIKVLTENSISTKYPCCVSCSKGLILTKSLEDYDKLIGDISSSTKIEVAREIFEEIEGIRLKEIRKCEILRERENEASQRKYWEGGYNSLRQLSYWFAELKKKYTKSEGKP